MLAHTAFVLLYNFTYVLLVCVSSVKLFFTYVTMYTGENDESFEQQKTMNGRGDNFESQQTMQVNPVFPGGDASHPSGNGKDSIGKGQKGKVDQSGYGDVIGSGTGVDSKDFLANQLNSLLNNSKNGYLKDLDHYKKDPKYKIDPTLHLAGEEEEIENFIVNEKVFMTTYIQYIDVYEEVAGADEAVETTEEVEYVEVPKYVTKYKPKIVVETVEKTIEVPSGEEIKQPKYNNVDVPYIIPNLIDNEILVVLKKIIQPEIEITNEVIEIEVEKYIPKLIPVNVYVPRYFGISAKAKGVVEESFRYVDLTQEQIDSLMKELNPHLEELRLFNENQLKRMEEYIKESRQQALSNNFEAPEPLAVSYDEQGNCKSFEYAEFNKIKESYLSQLIH